MSYSSTTSSGVVVKLAVPERQVAGYIAIKVFFIINKGHFKAESESRAAQYTQQTSKLVYDTY
jgi:hypothetical protein